MVGQGRIIFLLAAGHSHPRVADSSAATIRRILAAHQLIPWRHYLWLYPKHPRDAELYVTVSDLNDLYIRPLHSMKI